MIENALHGEKIAFKLPAVQFKDLCHGLVAMLASKLQAGVGEPRGLGVEVPGEEKAILAWFPIVCGFGQRVAKSQLWGGLPCLTQCVQHKDGRYCQAQAVVLCTTGRSMARGISESEIGLGHGRGKIHNLLILKAAKV